MNLELSDIVLLKLTPTLNIGNIYSSADYDDRRTYITSIGDNKFLNSREEITNKQSKSNNKVNGFFNFGLGADLISNVPIGIEIGWQGLDFGKTMNNLNPEGKYANQKFDTKTSAIYAKIIFQFGKRKE